MNTTTNTISEALEFFTEDTPPLNGAHDGAHFHAKQLGGPADSCMVGVESHEEAAQAFTEGALDRSETEFIRVDANGRHWWRASGPSAYGEPIPAARNFALAGTPLP